MALDVEAVSVRAEREAWEVLDAQEIRRYDPPPDPSIARRRLQAESLQLSEAMAPGVHALAREAAERLGVTGAIEIYQTRGEHENVLLANDAPIAIEFVGAWLTKLDRGGMLAVFGHELGHWIAHVACARYRWAYDAACLHRTEAQRAYAIAAELTADRFGVLASRDLDGILALEMRLAAGVDPSVLGIDPRAYLDQAKAHVQNLLRRGERVEGTSHPEHSVRAWAAWRFSESDLYRDITGEGPGTVPIAAIEDELSRIVGILHLGKKPATTLRKQFDAFVKKSR